MNAICDDLIEDFMIVEIAPIVMSALYELDHGIDQEDPNKYDMRIRNAILHFLPSEFDEVQHFKTFLNEQVRMTGWGLICRYSHACLSLMSVASRAVARFLVRLLRLCFHKQNPSACP